MSNVQNKKSSGFAREFIAGCFAGLGRLYIGQPFDIIKVRQQAGSNLSSWEIAKGVYGESGMKGFWKGSLYPLLGIGGTVSIQFGVNENVKKKMQMSKGRELKFLELYLCGGIAGFASSFVSTPVEHLRIRMQTQSKVTPLYSGSLDCAKQVYKKYGIKGLFRGGTITTIREIVGYGSFFGSFAWLTRQCLEEGQTVRDLSYWKIGVTGSLTGIAFWNSMFVFDTIKTKIQTDSFESPRYKGIMDCARQTYKASGFKGFFPGYLPCMARALPVNGGVFVLYEAFYRYVINYELQKNKIFASKKLIYAV